MQNRKYQEGIENVGLKITRQKVLGYLAPSTNKDNVAGYGRRLTTTRTIHTEMDR